MVRRTPTIRFFALPLLVLLLVLWVGMFAGESAILDESNQNRLLLTP
jgi:hypothetical protein